MILEHRRMLYGKKTLLISIALMLIILIGCTKTKVEINGVSDLNGKKNWVKSGTLLI